MKPKPSADPSGVMRAYGGTEDDFPTYILKVLGKDRSWMNDAACLDHDLVHVKAWTVQRQDEPVEIAGVTVEAKELIEAALMVCAGCHRQYQCALWAIEVEEESGTWSMPHDDLMWMWRQDDAEAMVHFAQIEGQPVQAIVKRARSAARRAQREARKTNRDSTTV
jgi:hypothetical protein